MYIYLVSYKQLGYHIIPFSNLKKVVEMYPGLDYDRCYYSIERKKGSKGKYEDETIIIEKKVVL